MRDGEALSPAAAEAFVDAVEVAVLERGIAVVALSGGTTAKKLFSLLTETPFAERLEPLWPRVHVFFAAERHVGPLHPESRYRVVHWSLLSRFDVPGRNIHRVRTTMSDPRHTAAAYENELRSFFASKGLMRDGLPCLDLALIALEPGSEREEIASRRDVEGCWVTTDGEQILLTLPVLGNARSALVLFPSGDAAAAGSAAHLLRFVA
ncbi:MAG TPA: 6-phosphogluconolactonase [Candidatus Polarisedimenticolaceae bacterium]|nr:6-phosphogluconolactonase [Candidatus Polarisedimenticolaceae bacterium]